MGKIVVAKKYSLGKDGDKFSKEFKTPIRNRVVIDEDEVKRFNKSISISGQMYEIDEKLTKERDTEVAKKKEAIKKATPKNSEQPDQSGQSLDEVKKELEELKKAIADKQQAPVQSGGEDVKDEPKKPGRPPKEDK